VRYEKTIHRDDGTVICLVALDFSSPFHPVSLDIFGLVKAANETSWEVVTAHITPNKTLGGMSVDDYIAKGRKGLLSVVTSAEIINVSIEARKVFYGHE